jgi:hypothetical protein
MLAVKLHRSKKPPLRKGSLFVPVMNWTAGDVQVRRMLNAENYPQNRVHYFTLVRIPEHFPVRFKFTYGASNFIKQVCWFTEFQPLRSWPSEVKHALHEWWDAKWQALFEGPGGLMADEPRVEIGATLPESCIKWTKDIRLLYRADKRKKAFTRGG